MYRLSQRSKDNLVGVSPKLVEVVNLAISISSVDFGVSQGIRSLEQQKEMVRKGASQTLNSKHIDGKAVDLFAYVDGAARWEIEYYFDIAKAIRAAAYAKQVAIRWGGAWNTPDIRTDKMTIEEMHNHYLRDRKRAKKKPFIDAGHFELAI